MLTPPSAWPARRTANGRPRPVIRLGGAHWEALEDERQQKRAYISRLKTIFHMEPLDLNLGDQLRESIASSVQECIGTTTLDETVDSIDSHIINALDNRLRHAPLDTAALVAAAQRDHHTLMHAPDDASVVTELKPYSSKQHVVKLKIQRPSSAHLPTPARHFASTPTASAVTGPKKTDSSATSTAPAPVAHLKAPAPFVKRPPLLRPTPSAASSMRPRSAVPCPTHAAQSNVARPVSAMKVAQQQHQEEQQKQQRHLQQYQHKEHPHQQQQQQQLQVQHRQAREQEPEEKQQEQKQHQQHHQHQYQRQEQLQLQQQQQEQTKPQVQQKQQRHLQPHPRQEQPQQQWQAQEQEQEEKRQEQERQQQQQYPQQQELHQQQEQTEPLLQQKQPYSAKSIAGYSTRSTRAPSSACQSSQRSAVSIYSRQSTAAKQRCPSTNGSCTEIKTAAARGSTAAVGRPPAKPVAADVGTAGTAARSTQMRHRGRKAAEQPRVDDWRSVKEEDARTPYEQCGGASKVKRHHGTVERKAASGGAVEAKKRARAEKNDFGDTFRALGKEEDALQRSLLRLDFLEMKLAKGDGEKEMSLAQFAHESSLGQAYVIPAKATTESALLRSLQRLDRLLRYQ
eukprot:GEMP01033600.1.p1 GENE.GEMP01033600.1~~GEMP01033600.1.p1  ORF type:complete len:625 (+),score=214.11 GEMP01033600.1:31-1905(+)